MGPSLCIGTTLANLNGLGNSAIDMLRLKICVSAGAIIGAASASTLVDCLDKAVHWLAKIATILATTLVDSSDKAVHWLA